MTELSVEFNPFNRSLVLPEMGGVFEIPAEDGDYFDGSYKVSSVVGNRPDKRRVYGSLSMHDRFGLREGAGEFEDRNFPLHLLEIEKGRFGVSEKRVFQSDYPYDMTEDLEKVYELADFLGLELKEPSEEEGEAGWKKVAVLSGVLAATATITALAYHQHKK